MVQRVYRSWCGGERDIGQSREQRVERKRHQPGVEKTATKRERGIDHVHGGELVFENHFFFIIFFLEIASSSL